MQVQPRAHPDGRDPRHAVPAHQAHSQRSLHSGHLRVSTAFTPNPRPSACQFSTRRNTPSLTGPGLDIPGYIILLPNMIVHRPVSGMTRTQMHGCSACLFSQGRPSEPPLCPALAGGRYRVRPGVTHTFPPLVGYALQNPLFDPQPTTTSQTAPGRTAIYATHTDT